MINFKEAMVAEPEFLRVTTIGNYAFEELFDFLARVKSAAVLHGRKRILIDSRQLVGNMTEVERFQGGQKIAEVFGGRLAVALVMPPECITKLGELTAVNRGARFMVSSSEFEAMDWLLKRQIT